MIVAPEPVHAQLLLAAGHHYTHLWDLQIHLTLKHYVTLFAVVWAIRSRIAMYVDDGERRENRRRRKTGSRYRHPGRLEQKRPW